MRNRRISLLLAFGWLSLLGCLAAGADLLGDPLRMDLAARVQAPGADWLGTDELGRDLVARLFHAARFTLVVTAGATAFALTFGFALGAAAAWFGRFTDAAVMALVNLFWSVPFAVFAVLLVAIIGANTTTLIVAIGGVTWVSSARVFRSEMLRLRRSEFVVAARAAGFSPWQILFTHALPNLRAAAVGLLGYGAAETLALESGLAFLGLSLPPPLPTWGGMMADGLAHFSVGWWTAAVPAAMVTITLASLRALADVVEEAHASG